MRKQTLRRVRERARDANTAITTMLVLLDREDVIVDPIDGPLTQVMCVRMPDDWPDRIKTVAESQGMGVSGWLRSVVHASLVHEEEVS